MRVLVMLAWVLAVLGAQPVAAASSPRLLPLEQQLASLLATRSGEYRGVRPTSCLTCVSTFLAEQVIASAFR